MQRTPFSFLSVIVLTMLFIAACASQFGNSSVDQKAGVAIDVVAPLFPPGVGVSDLVLKVTDSTTGLPIDDAYLSVKGDMDHDDMMPVLTSSKSGTNGEYTIPFEWTMGGDWQVLVHATLTDGTQVSQEFDLVVDGNEVTCQPAEGKEETQDE